MIKGKVVRRDRCSICRSLTQSLVPVVADIPEVQQQPRAVHAIELCRGCLTAVRARRQTIEVGDGQGAASATQGGPVDGPSATPTGAEPDALLLGIAEHLKVEPHRVQCNVRIGEGAALLLDVLLDGRDLAGPEEQLVIAYLAQAFPGVKPRVGR